MQGDVGTAIRYLFILSVILILVAYYAGSKQVIGAFGTQFGNLGNIFTGRTTSGNFAGYPGNAPTG